MLSVEVVNRGTARWEGDTRVLRKNARFLTNSTSSLESGTVLLPSVFCFSTWITHPLSLKAFIHCTLTWTLLWVLPQVMGSSSMFALLCMNLVCRNLHLMKNGKTTIPSMVYLLIYLLGQWRHGYHRRHLLLYISRTKLCPAPSGYANQWGWMNIPSESPLGTDSLGILDKIVLIYHWYSLNSSHHEVGVGGRHKREKILYIYIYTHTHTHTHT